MNWDDTAAGKRPADQSPTRSRRGASPTKIGSSRQPSTSAPMLSATASSNSLFSFGGRNGTASEIGGDTTTAGSFDFLPSVSFDDLHSSIESASTDFKLNQFPLPKGQGSILNEERLADAMVERSNIPHHSGGTTTRVAIQQPAPATRPSRSGSILRRPSTSNRQSSISSIVSNSSMLGTSNITTTAPAPARTRRQSHYPPVSNTNIIKPPRKSIGPGVLDGGEYETRTGQRRRPSLISGSDRGGLDSTRSSMDGGTRIIPDVSSRHLSSSRASKARSVQPPPRTSQATLSSEHSTASLTPDHNRVSLAFSRSRASFRGSNPPSSGKRVSVMPGVPHASHATGLGARTISPTDTRRMKRLSNMNDVLQSQPQLTHPPPPLSTETRPSSRSPSMLPRKTSTPSSSRTTPDLNRKSYSSGLSVGSTTSYNTVRTSTGSIQPRIPQSTSSRLPAPKVIGLHSTASAGEEEEDVPPVPAIPKVYESPRDLPGELSFLDKRKSSIAFDASSINSASTGSLSGAQGSEPPMKIQRKQSDRKSIHTSKVELDKKGVGAQLRKNLQPLTLPPIHLGPLSTPTAAKIAALHERSTEKNYSPTPARQISKTPSTPMTASKSTFFSRNLAEEKAELGSIRSSSSVHHVGFDSPPVADATSSSESLMAPSSITKNVDRTAMSPFLSSSAPKSSNTLEQNMAIRSKTGGGYTLPLDSGVADDLPQPKPAGPRAVPMLTGKPIKPPAASKSPPPHSSSEEPPTPSSMSSLRRKLSLSWKRSASKASGNHPQGEKDSQGYSVRKDSMPPPRLPISATVSHLSTAKPSSPTSKPPPTYLESRRRKSSASSLNAFMAQDKNRTESITASVKKESNLDTVTERSAHHPLQKLLKPRASMGAMRAYDVWTAELDKDDLIAEEEMRRLGERRKETELAARTLDALRKRATAKDRVSPQDAIRIAMLNIYERGEIVDHKDVYFCGTQHAAKVVGNVQSDLPNFGYDDERGDYAIVPGDHLAYRYEIIDVLGKGSFGQVVRCIDHKTGVLVAVKIIRNKKRFHQQALVEVNILQKLREWDPKNKHSMVNFTHSFYFRGHLCISTELLDMNLYEFIKSNAFRGFSLKLVRRFTKQLLSSLNLLKQHKVIHCDLKPENILLRHPLHSEIKMIDFGSSCFENEKVYTYIQSRFYRSPEVILGMTYGMPIDMWSLGCILAELYTGVPIFPGENEQEQLACIMEVFGPPEKHLIEKSTRKKIFFDSMGKPRLTVSSKGRRRRPSSKTLQQVLKCDDEAFLDFLARCLRWDPDRRMKPDEAIRHEFITGQKSSVPVPRGSSRDLSPPKRSSNSNASSAPRPLPEPPMATISKPTTSLRPRDTTGASGISPMKPSGAVMSRRTSNAAAMSSISSGAAGKRNTGPPIAAPAATAIQNVTASASLGGSGLPRVAARSVSGKSDLAAAGATAAMSRRA